GGFDGFVLQLTEAGPLDFTAPAGSGAASYTVGRNGDDVQIVDGASGTVLQTKPLADTTAVMIRAADGVNTTLHTDSRGGTLPVPLTFVGGSGQDTLVGPNDNSTWEITGDGAGQVGGVRFSGVENLVGGTAADLFRFGPLGHTGSINGGGGGDRVESYTP